MERGFFSSIFIYSFFLSYVHSIHWRLNYARLLIGENHTIQWKKCEPTGNKYNIWRWWEANFFAYRHKHHMPQSVLNRWNEKKDYNNWVNMLFRSKSFIPAAKVFLFALTDVDNDCLNYYIPIKFRFFLTPASFECIWAPFLCSKRCGKYFRKTLLIRTFTVLYCSTATLVQFHQFDQIE